MNELPVRILDNEDCSSMWLRVGIHVLDDQLCVGYGDTGACYVSLCLLHRAGQGG